MHPIQIIVLGVALASVLTHALVVAKTSVKEVVKAIALGDAKHLVQQRVQCNVRMVVDEDAKAVVSKYAQGTVWQVVKTPVTLFVEAHV